MGKDAGERDRSRVRLPPHPGTVVCVRRCGEEGREGTSTFAVETRGLHEGLGQSDLVAPFGEVADSEAILGGVFRGGTSVHHIEEGELEFLLPGAI